MLQLRYILVFLSVFSVFSLHAQRQKHVEYLSDFDQVTVRWGFYLGLNYNDYKISYKAPEEFPDAYVQTQPKMGFNIGLIGDLRLHQNISLRFEPGLMTNAKTLYFNHLSNSVDSVRDISGTFLHVPVLVQFNTNRLNNVRPFVAGGVSYDYNFASNFNNPDDNTSGEFRMLKNNFMYEIAIGADFYLHYFKFSPSLRGVFAINNEIKADDDPNSPWTKPVDYFGTRGIFLQFTFQ